MSVSDSPPQEKRSTWVLAAIPFLPPLLHEKSYHDAAMLLWEGQKHANEVGCRWTLATDCPEECSMREICDAKRGPRP